MKIFFFKRKINSSILLFLFIFSSSLLLFFAQVNNNSSKRESVENSEGLNLSATYMTTTEVVSTESTGASFYSTIAVDSVGNIHVAWVDTTNYSGSGNDPDIFYKQWNVTSSTWTTTEVVSTESASSSDDLAIAVDSVGNIHVAWEDGTNYDGSGSDYDIFYKRRNASNNTWTVTEVVSTESTSSCIKPTIAADSAGNVHVAWDELTNYGGSGIDSDIFYKRWNATSSTWTTTEVVSTESIRHSNRVKITVDGTGNAHVVWEDPTYYNGSGNDNDIFYKQWNATSSTWTMAEVVSTESDIGSGYPSIAVDVVGNIHVVWMDWADYGGSEADRDIFYKHKEVISSTWTMTEVVSTESAEHSLYPKIAVDDPGNVHVVWEELTNYGGSGMDNDIFYKHRDATSSTWTITEVVSTMSTDESKRPTIAADRIGNSYIAWRDSMNYGGSGTDLDIFYKRLNPAPNIVIYSPDQNQYSGNTAPNFDISIGEPKLNTTWYTLDYGLTNKTFIGDTGTIDQTEWDKKSHGAVTIRFYANDSFGFDGYAEVVINKDLNPPTSLLSFSPYRGINEVNISTVFFLSANDGSESGVLNIRYQINDSAWTDYTGPFTLSAFPIGDYLITYYATDTVGNVEAENTLLVKLVEIPVQEPLPDIGFIIITASVIGGIGLAIAITVIIIRKRK